MSLSAFVFIISVLVGLTLNAGVFRYNPKAPSGSIIYNIYLKDKLMCLRACYEEINCAFVTYEEDMAERCRLFESGDGNGQRSGYILLREETDAACTLIEISDADIAFQKIPYQEVAEVECSNAVSDVAIISPYVSHGKYRFFVLNSAKVPDWTAKKHRLFISKRKEETCTAVPIFHKANHRRLYFGEVYNTTGYYFYDAYAFANYCVSPEGLCLGVVKIQEYVDEQNLYFYDRAGRDDVIDSGLGQIFYIASIEN
ncbi:unnamed protein product [Cylicocyclus nassatus]|uniref:Apple domain-containing protein n=1 Tax=Cylicocyclus nassatus TaxID=53992 RepID=A0AA36GEG7_CYLNA|nr:unnamed protein product [Cylicocyclus nassatus]